MLVVSAAVGFLLWYTLVREAHEIQPLVPALQSWWMKLHVPANFIGYGTFALAAMVAFAYLIKQQAQRDALVQADADLAAGRGAVLRAGGVPPARAGGRRQLLGGLRGHLGADRGRHPAGPQAHRGAAAGARGAGRRDVQVHHRRLRLLHHRHRAGRAVGGRRLGRLLELGPEGNLGADRLAQLRGLAAHAAGQGPARHRGGLVGAGRAGGDDLRLPGRQHVPERACTATAPCKTPFECRREPCAGA